MEHIHQQTECETNIHADTLNATPTLREYTQTHAITTHTKMSEHASTHKDTQPVHNTSTCTNTNKNQNLIAKS